MTREQLINKVISAVPLDDISIAKDAVDEYTQQEYNKIIDHAIKIVDEHIGSGYHLSADICPDIIEKLTNLKKK